MYNCYTRRRKIRESKEDAVIIVAEEGIGANETTAN
jgi:hypothetical protein